MCGIRIGSSLGPNLSPARRTRRGSRWNGCQMWESAISHGRLWITLASPRLAMHNWRPRPGLPSPLLQEAQVQVLQARQLLQEVDSATANIYLSFPWFNSNCGDIDLIGETKPQLELNHHS